MFFFIVYTYYRIDNMDVIEVAINKNVKNSKVRKQEEENKKKRRRILLLLLLLLLLISLLGGVTYAWFSSNKNATIDMIDINVETLTGIQASADAINWSNDITKEQLINAYKTYPAAENQLPDTMAGVSTDGSVSNGKMNMYYGVIHEYERDVFSLTSIKQSEINCVGDDQCKGKHYVAFDIFFLTTQETNLVVTANSSVVNRNDDRGSQNSARVGFVVLGTVSSDNPRAAQNLKNGTTGLIWEPNYDVHTQAGVNAASSIYGINTTMSGGARIPYRGINQEFSEAVNLTDTDTSPYFSNVTPHIATTKVFSEDQELVTIPTGITKMRIYMWLEGEDVDLENSAADSQLTFNLEIAMAEEKINA